MKPEELISWLSGYLHDKDRDLTKEETAIIKEKLESCFNKVTPNLGYQTVYNLQYFNPDVPMHEWANYGSC